MSASKREDRRRLDGCEAEIFKLVDQGGGPGDVEAVASSTSGARRGQRKLGLFKRLIDAGARVKPGWRGCHGQTLLGVAASSESGKMVRAVLEAGGTNDIDVLFGAKHESALHVAAARGAEDLCMALMVAGADPNLRDQGGCSPLHLAAEAGHDRVLGMLLLKGAQLDAKTTTQETPLHLAASQGHALCISELLLGGADKDVDDGSGKTPLFKAVENNHLRAVEILLAAGATRCRLNYEWSTPLEEAANIGHATIMTACLQAGSEVNASDCQGHTALHGATAIDGPVQDNGDAVRVLLGAGADVDAEATGDGCYTPLHVAVDRRIASIGTTRAVLQGGANVNARDEYNQTPLHAACSWSSVAAVELLLRWGADEKLTEFNGGTPTDVIGMSVQDGTNNEQIQADHQRIRQMLVRAPADRLWRRRGWLALSRAYPTRVQIANESHGSITTSNGGSAKVARVSNEDSGPDDEEAEDQMAVEWRGLVGRVVGLEVDGLFRLVVSFL